MKASIIIVGRNPCVFFELALAIKDSLHMLNIESGVYFYEKYYREEDLNIFIHGLRHSPSKENTNILLQTETKYNANISRRSKDWNLVLDLFPEQCEYKNTVYFPMGYSRRFDEGDKRIKEENNKFFFGYVPPRRRDFIIKNKILCLPGFGYQRDNNIRKAKLNVSIKPKDESFYSPLRGLLVMSKGSFLLQEETEGGKGVYKKFLKTFQPRDFRKKADYWIRKERRRKEFAFYVREELKENYKFEESFHKCIKGIL